VTLTIMVLLLALSISFLRSCWLALREWDGRRFPADRWFRTEAEHRGDVRANAVGE